MYAKQYFMNNKNAVKCQTKQNNLQCCPSKDTKHYFRVKILWEKLLGATRGSDVELEGIETRSVVLRNLFFLPIFSLLCKNTILFGKPYNVLMKETSWAFFLILTCNWFVKDKPISLRWIFRSQFQELSRTNNIF